MTQLVNNVEHHAPLSRSSLCMHVFQQSHSLLDKSDIVRHGCTNAPSSQQFYHHHIDVIMTTVASQITSLAVVYSIVYSDADERKHQRSASLAFGRGIHRDRWIHRTKAVTRKMFPFDDVIMILSHCLPRQQQYLLSPPSPPHGSHQDFLNRVMVSVLWL